MRIFKFLLICLLILGSTKVLAHESVDKRIPIDHVLENYSKIHGTKFVMDPRVKAIVTIVGFEVDALTQANIVDILVLHGFNATEKDGIVYILPQIAVDNLGGNLGPIWGSQ